MKYTFVILNYLSTEDTIECVSSLLNCFSNDISVVIVDNASYNNAKILLTNKFSKYKNVKIIINKNNLGFAKGNNVGIKYSLKQFDPNFIICLNNDTIITQTSFLKKIDTEYRQSSFWLLGPLIYTADGRYTSNPLHSAITSINKWDAAMHRKRKELFYTKWHLDYLQKIWQIIKMKSSNYFHETCLDSLTRQEGIPLHGSCIIFSREFFKHLNGFNPHTFLYQEENILFNEVIIHGGKVVYNPELNIFHKEDASLKSVKLGKRNKKIFMIQNEIDSLKVLRKVLLK
ncbi:glycosyltransferase family 2 protein [Loigolactobacillus coryniformis]|uniref:glycosyltransferase n=1 Tax=Loigolactobacillus coryniformis TaxID=1610 RepID=UPI00201A246B|nr:glycosyltransferase family 2 protein [Loigolactobacillus coryniformis]MCL5457522.1 glycosyltransferase family 2 protein [Loigolactobacillus coryniformis]